MLMTVYKTYEDWFILRALQGKKGFLTWFMKLPIFAGLEYGAVQNDSLNNILSDSSEKGGWALEIK